MNVNRESRPDLTLRQITQLRRIADLIYAEGVDDPEENYSLDLSREERAETARNIRALIEVAEDHYRFCD